MVDIILKNISKSKDKVVLKAMCFLDPLTKKNADNIKSVTQYVEDLCALSRKLSPINVSYDMSLNELDESYSNFYH